MRLGILDFCQLRKGVSPQQVLHETLSLAQAAEAQGFSRYWLTEHHELVSAHHAPDLLAALIAGSTERIRVGVAGVLLKLHSPMRVAKTFRLMETFFPERIDLGVGAGQATLDVVEAMRGQPRTLPELRDEYPQSVEQLVLMLRGESPLTFNPPILPPPIWLLASTRANSALMAARHGTCFGYSLVHQTSVDNPEALHMYRSEFRPHALQPRPEAVLAVQGHCAPTEEEARKRVDSMGPNAANAFAVIGNPQQCREQLEAHAHRYGVDELIFTDLVSDLEARQRSLQLLSEVLGLPASGTS